MSGHDYRDERIYGPRGPRDAWDTPDGDGGYIWQRILSAHDAMREYQKKHMPNCGVDKCQSWEK